MTTSKYHTMQQWEYLCVSPSDSFTPRWEGEKITLEEFLNKKGQQGWQLIQGPSYQHSYCIFKRLIPQVENIWI